MSVTDEAIGRGEYPYATLLLFDLAGTLRGFWDGVGPLTVEGVTYVGAGSLIKIEPLNAVIDISASPLRVTLRAIPDSHLTPDVLATIDDEPYKNAPAFVSQAFFDRTTGALVTVQRLWQGYVDTVNHDETIGGEYALVGVLEPRSLDHSRRGYRMRTDEDQRRLDPNDRFFEHAATTPTEQLPYGRNANGTQPPNTYRGPDGISGKSGTI
jgi:hypothetical protein